MNDVSGLAEIIIGKQRHGPTGNIHVEFEGMYTKFKDLTKNNQYIVFKILYINELYLINLYVL